MATDMEMTLPREAGECFIKELTKVSPEGRAVFCNVRNLSKGSRMYKVCQRVTCRLGMSVIQ